MFPRLFLTRKRHGRVALGPNRRPFRARCGDDPLWIILDNQHP
ncbi:hypothetical protein [Aneurinibacillus aneurinilyticus]